MRKALYCPRRICAGPAGLPFRDARPLCRRATHAGDRKNRSGAILGMGRAGIARGVYAAVQGRTLIVLHVFVKKTRTTPRVAIETARTRLEAMR